jgi:hypothetical protein
LIEIGYVISRDVISHNIKQLNICFEVVKIYFCQQEFPNPELLLHKSVLVGGRHLPVLIN